jgi:hypothetical protein
VVMFRSNAVVRFVKFMLESALGFDDRGRDVTVDGRGRERESKRGPLSRRGLTQRAARAQKPFLHSQDQSISQSGCRRRF